MIGLTELLLLITSILIIIYAWSKLNYSYWRRKNVPYCEPALFFENLKEFVLGSISIFYHFQRLYHHKKTQDEPIVGMFIFNKPALMIREPDLIKSILVKDFIKFSNRNITADPHRDVLGSKNLFFAKNSDWRDLRTKLTPVFSSAKLKQMFSLIEEVGEELDKYLSALEIDSKTESCDGDIKEICRLYTIDVVATVAFGIQANSLKNPNGEFPRSGQHIFSKSRMRALQMIAVLFLPGFARLFRCKVFSKKSRKFLRDTVNFVMTERIRRGNTRNDLIDTLIDFKKADELNTGFKMENEVLVAQAATFFAAGYETSSSTMTFALFELSKAPKLQNRLRDEIQEALTKSNGKVTYEMPNEMEYLNMVIQEVLRLYPPLPFVDREYTMPKGETEYTLKPYSDFAIPNGMPVYIPIYAIQRDPKGWTPTPPNIPTHTRFISYIELYKELLTLRK